MTYPILLNLRGRRVVVVGGGTVAARKAAALLDAGAQVVVISPALHPALAALATRLEYQPRRYEPGLLARLLPAPLLVFAATDVHAVNAQVTAEARDLGLLVDVADDASAGDFASMAVLRRGEITIGLATGGAAPALAAHLRARLEHEIGAEYATLARWLGELRPLIRSTLPPAARRTLWHAIVASPALERLRAGDEAGARAIIDALITDASNESQ